MDHYYRCLSPSKMGFLERNMYIYEAQSSKKVDDKKNGVTINAGSIILTNLFWHIKPLYKVKQLLRGQL